MKKPSGKSYHALLFKTVLDAIVVLMEGFGKFAEVVAELLRDNEDYRQRVIDFILSGAFIPGDEYERAKRIMGFHFSGVEQAFRLGLTFRHMHLGLIQRIPFTEETLTRFASTHYLVLVPSGLYTMFRDSRADAIQNPEQNIRETVQSGWHWILYRIDAVMEVAQNEELVPLFDALYVREVFGVTNPLPLRVGNTFKTNGGMLVLVPQGNNQYDIQHHNTTVRWSCVMVKPDKV